jgi:hypothetical protein
MLSEDSIKYIEAAAKNAPNKDMSEEETILKMGEICFELQKINDKLGNGHIINKLLTTTTKPYLLDHSDLMVNF